MSMKTLALLAHSRLVNISVGFLLASVWLLFAYSHVREYIETGKWSYLVFCLSESVQAFFFLFRRSPRIVSLEPFAWLVAIGGTFAPLCFRPGGVVVWSGGEMLLTFGVLVQVIALCSLNRSFGIVAASRIIKTRGLYRVVRHPMYASYIFSFTGYLFYNFSLFNFLCVLFALIFMYFRIAEEERLLLKDESYQHYAQTVRYRLIPLVY